MINELVEELLMEYCQKGIFAHLQLFSKDFCVCDLKLKHLDTMLKG